MTNEPAALQPSLSDCLPSPDGSIEARPTRPSNLDVIMDIQLPLVVRFASARMTLHALAQLGPGSVIDLDRSADDLVDVLVNGRAIARGEVVVAAGNYGVRITDVLDCDDRIRTIGA